MLFRTGQNWVVDFFLRRGWLVKRRLTSRPRPSSWNLLSTVPAECLEERILLSTITVTSLDDNLTTDGQVTLREAIEAANTDASVDGSVAGDVGVQNKIIFAPGLTGTIALDSSLGQLSISSSLEIDGLGAANTVIDAQQYSRIFEITIAAGDVTLSGLTLQNGLTTVDGESGGAIQNLSTGTLAILDSTLTGNSTLGDSAVGGAISNAGGTLTVTRSTLSGNSATCDDASGGAIYNATGIVTITNSTLTGNSTVDPGANGGAIYSLSGSLTVINSTIAQNHVTIGVGGGLAAGSAASVTVRNTILAQNTDNGTAPDLYVGSGGTLTVSHSLIGDNTGSGLPAPVGPTDANGNLIGTAGTPIDPLLGPLQFNGGPTQTMALLASSPALDAGSNAEAIDPNSSDPLDIDQRGAPFGRIFDTTVDIGAYESQSLSLIVTSADDTLDPIYDPVHVTLRDALVLANINRGRDTITFAPALNGTEIDLTLGQLTISDTVTITGNGAAQTVIDAQHNSRIFSITSAAGNVTLDGLTLKDGRTTSIFASGGAIRATSTGTLSILNSLLSGNSTKGDYASGGAISDNNGSVVITNSSLIGNSTAGYAAYGGAIGSKLGDVTITDSTLSGNSTGGYSSGGGAVAGFTVTVTDSALSGNYTDDDYARGGAITALHDVVVTGSTFSGNYTTGRLATGGAIDSVLGDVTVTASTLSGNYTTGKFSDGGAIYAKYGLVTLAESSLVGNHTTNSQARGGAISSGGTGVTVLNSTLSGNSTAGKGAVGGAIAAAYGVVVTNSTLSGNFTAGSDASGGAIYSYKGAVTITNGTIAQNHAVNSEGGGIYAYDSTATITLTNTILAQNTDDGTAPDLDLDPGATLTVSHSLIGDNTGTTLAAVPVGTPNAKGNIIGTGAAPINPLLGVLAFNGGPTKTMALLAGSPALNAGSNVLAIDPTSSNPLTTDQRGAPFARVFNTTIDMGAFEAQTLSLVVTSTGDTLDPVYDPAHLTLRDALAQANLNPSDSTITFDSTVFPAGLLTTITLVTGSLEISNTRGKITMTGLGAGRVAIDGNTSFGDFEIDVGASAEINSLTITGGFAHLGGGFLNYGTLKVQNDVITGNAADFGGGFYNAGTMTVIDSTISNNSGVGSGGFNVGVFGSDGVPNASLSIISSTVANNSGLGLLNAGSATIINSTITGNGEGGVTNEGGGTGGGQLTIIDSTISANFGTNGGAGIKFASDSVSGFVKLSGTILAGNTTTKVSTTPDDWEGLFADASSSFNLIGDGTDTGLVNGVNHNIVGTAGSPIPAYLASLANNGGPTQTMALLPGSRARDAGAIFNDPGANPITTDQRGNTRYFGAVDIGAFQNATSTLAISHFSNQANGRAAHVVQTGTNTVAFINEAGAVVLGVMTDPTHATVAAWGNDIATFNVDGSISWSDGSVWNPSVAPAPQITVTDYTISGRAAYLIQNGTATAILVNEKGSVVLGNWISPTRVFVPDWFNDVGTFSSGKINWSDGSLWTQSVVGALPVVTLDYVNAANGGTTHVVQNGTNTVAFMNEMGAFVLGVLTDATHATVAAWGNDVATFNPNGSISWSDGSTWNRTTTPSAHLTVTDYVTSSRPAYLIQNGTTTAVFVNENGAVVLGNWISPKRIVVPAWSNDVGTFNGGTINWSDGSVWTQSSAGALPVAMIIYVNPANGRPALAVQNGTGTVAFFNEFGDVVLGVMTDATHATVAAWGNDVATFNADGTISWSDHSVWNRATTSPPGPLVSTFANRANGLTAYLIQNSMPTLVFVNELGNIVLGIRNSSTQATVPAWSNDVATILNGKLNWSDGSVWTPFV